MSVDPLERETIQAERTTKKDENSLNYARYFFVHLSRALSRVDNIYYGRSEIQ